MLKSFFISFFATLAIIFSIHNTIQISQSLDRCEKIVGEIKQAGEQLKIYKTYYNF